jgi:hypothetical protein
MPFQGLPINTISFQQHFNTFPQNFINDICRNYIIYTCMILFSGSIMTLRSWHGHPSGIWSPKFMVCPTFIMVDHLTRFLHSKLFISLFVCTGYRSFIQPLTFFFSLVFPLATSVKFWIFPHGFLLPFGSKNSRTGRERDLVHTLRFSVALGGI